MIATEPRPIAEASLAIEELAEEVQRENDRRYAFYRMLNATDRVLWRLEELNRNGVKRIPSALRRRIRDTLADLPRECLAELHDSDRVQEVLDSVFEVQYRLFCWRDPQRPSEEEEPEPAPVDESGALWRRVLARLLAHPEGLTWSNLARGFSGTEQPHVLALVRVKEAAGAVILRDCRSRPGVRPSHRYFVAAPEAESP